MSTPLFFKRRRIEQSQSALSKPFVSPLRSAKADRKPLHDDHNGTQQVPYLPSTLAHTIRAIGSEPNSSLRSAAGCPTTPKLPFPRPSPLRATKPANPTELAARRTLTALEAQIKVLRHEIDTLNQARRIRDSSTNRELVKLTEKWRLTSQHVADELFESVKERVSQMGGVAAWRESETRKLEAASRFQDFEEQSGPRVSGDADDGFDDGVEHMAEEAGRRQKRARRRTMEEAAGGTNLLEEGEDFLDSGTEQELDEGDTKFTMEMMLRSLNIELDVIGYDRERQQWN